MPIRISKNRVALQNIPLELGQSASIASAATVNLATATGNEVHITGSSGPITSFGTVPSGTTFTIIFDSTPTIVFNATSMILNSGTANYVCSAGDRAIAVSEGAGNWVVTLFKSDGTSASSGTVRSITASTNALITDTNGVINANHASVAIVITIQSDAATSWGTNAALLAYQSGAAAVSFVAGAGVTLHAGPSVPTAAQYVILGALRVGANEWVTF